MATLMLLAGLLLQINSTAHNGTDTTKQQRAAAHIQFEPVVVVVVVGHACVV